MVDQITAHIDEAGARLSNGRRLYVIAAVLTKACDHPQITGTLVSLQEAGLPLHYRGERQDRRVLVAHALSGLPIQGAILLKTSSTDTGQERARSRLLCELLPRLEHLEHVHEVTFESRGGGDKHDRGTINRLRRSRIITAKMQIAHAGKPLPLLWPADWIASAYVGANHHEEGKPWTLMNEEHFIDVLEIEP
jgi:hypothetical protein